MKTDDQKMDDQKTEDQMTDDSLMTDDGKHPEEISWLENDKLPKIFHNGRDFEEGSVSNEPSKSRKYIKTSVYLL